ncbi:MAG: nitroreductase family protein [Deltaproteobacteria bacterium]|jgi:nitroreductase/NAD-dependent dihydropyrimidine dehydrogenase PreA subunit|nr:nitroreductase family protein [Deltaproteobacteria bacterium]
MEDLQFKIDEDSCVKCGLCAKDCPNRVINSPKDEFPKLAEGRSGNCLECQHCLAVCPTGSLSIFGVDPKELITVSKSDWPSPESVRAFVRDRRSIRHFKNENVSKPLLDTILSDLQFAPTARNRRFLDFIVIDDIAAMDAFRESMIRLSEKALSGGLESPFVKGVVKYYRRDSVDVLFRGAPHIIVVSAQESQVGGLVDVALTLAYFEFLAATSGIGTCWCGFLPIMAASVPGVRELLGIGPKNHFYALYFGLPAIKYMRIVKREGTATIRRLSAQELSVQ